MNLQDTNRLMDKALALLGDGHNIEDAVDMLFKFSEATSLPFTKEDCVNIVTECHKCHNMSQVSQPITSVTGMSQFNHNLITNVSQQVSQWVADRPGNFTTKDLYFDLGLSNKSDKDAARQALKRLVESKDIVPIHGKRGAYRAIDRSEDEEMDLLGASENPFPFFMPLDLHDIVEVNEKDIIILGGEPNTGKTAWSFAFTWGVISGCHNGVYNKYIYSKSKSKNKYIYYQSSEAGPSETKKRILRYKGSTPIPGTPVLNAFVDNVKFTERNCNFADHVNPDGVNVIDFLEVLDGEYYKIASIITEIHMSVKTGITLICLQKNHGSQFAEGGSKSLQKPRLFVNLSNDPEGRGFFTAKIMKAKHFKNINPNGMERDYMIDDGVFIRPLSPWAYKAKLDASRRLNGYVNSHYKGDPIKL